MAANLWHHGSLKMRLVSNAALWSNLGLQVHFPPFHMFIHEPNPAIKMHFYVSWFRIICDTLSIFGWLVSNLKVYLWCYKETTKFKSLPISLSGMIYENPWMIKVYEYSLFCLMDIYAIVEIGPLMVEWIFMQIFQLWHSDMMWDHEPGLSE